MCQTAPTPNGGPCTSDPDGGRHQLCASNVSGYHRHSGTWCSGITSAPHAEGPGFKSQCVHVHNIVRAHMCRCVPRGRSKAIGARPRLGAALDHCPSIQLCICPGKHTQWHHTQAARGPVAQWIRHRPTEPGIAGSSPAGVICRLSRPLSMTRLQDSSIAKVKKTPAPGTGDCSFESRRGPAARLQQLSVCPSGGQA